MKKTSWNRRQFRQLAGAGALLFGALLCGVTSASAQQTNSPAKPADTAKPADADDSELVNWVDVGVGGNIVTGDKAQFQHQTGSPANAFGGINGFHYELPVGKKGTFTADGRGIFDNHDYDIKLEVAHPEIGYVKAGFRSYREYYDGTGGFLPTPGVYKSLPNKDLSLDRGTAFFETGLTLPDWPVITLRYEHDYRSGAKDSTEWGEIITTGTTQKRINPAYLLLDEKTDSIALDITHTLKNTDFGLGVSYIWQSDNDSGNKYMQTALNGPNQLLSQTERDKTDTFVAHAFTDTRLNEKLELTTGYEFTSLRSDVAGDRLDTPNSPTTPDTRYVNLAGGSDLDQYTMNLSMMYSPNDDWHIIPAFRVEKEIINGADADNAFTTPGGVSTVGALTSNRDNENQLNFAESLDARYVGVTNWVLYARGEWEENRALLDQFTGTTPIPAELVDQDWHQLMQKYSIGANWYPQRGLNFAASAYHKIDNNNYNIDFTLTPAAYPGFIQRQNFITDGANFRATWRPLSQLTLVSRYDFAYSTVDMQGYQLQLIPIANTTTHMFGETVSWTPLNRLYVQAGANYVLDTTHTPTENLTGGIVGKSQNDYWTFNSQVGYAFDDKTDAQVGYTYYRSADYADNSLLGGVPYGAGSEEHIVTATLGRQIRRNLHATVRYGYTSYRDQLFGGNTDYRAHTILASLQYRF